MAAGSIVVSLLMETGSFETDANRAAKTAEKRSREIEASFKKAGSVVGVALAATAVALGTLTKAGIDSLDALNDVADATGASIENISALEQVALATGTTLDNVSGILVKFNNVLKEAEPDSGAAKTLKAIGLNAEELRKLDPAEALRQTAVALSKFADDGNKARIVQELFGKSVKDAAPFLKDLAEKADLVGVATKADAEQAEKFNKNVFELERNLANMGKTIAIAVLPALNDIFVRFNRAREAGQDFSTSLARGFGVGGLNKALENPYENLKKTTAEIERLQAIISNPGSSRGQLNFASQRLEQAQKDAKELQLVIDNIDKQLEAPASGGLPTAPGVPSSGGGKKTKLISTESKADLEFMQEAWSFVGKEQDAYLERQQQILLENHKAAESYRDMLDPTRELGREIKAIQDLVESGALTPDEGLAAELKKLNEFYGEAETAISGFEEFTKSAARNMQTAFADFLFDPFKEGTDGMLKSFGLTIKRMVAEAVSADLMNRLLGSLKTTSTSGSGFGGLLEAFSGLFGGFRANGGDVQAGKAYVVGEKRPELFVPKTAGTIIPDTNMSNGSSTQNINLTVNVASGTPDAVRRSAAAGAREALSALAGAQRYA